MIKKTIKFNDLDGKPLEETFYFNLRRDELMRMEFMEDGGSYSDHIKKIAEAKNGGQIFDTFEQIIRASLGYRHEDGVQFVKEKAYTDRFMNSEAYSELFTELMMGGEKDWADFINGIMSISQEDIAKMEAAKQARQPQIEAPKTESQAPSVDELRKMLADAERDD